MYIEIDNNKYELIKDEREAFNEEEFRSRYTDYFKDYDYIVSDIAYSKLRLKGFNDKTNKNYNKFNDSKNIDKYILDNCAYGCKHFILKKIS